MTSSPASEEARAVAKPPDGGWGWVVVVCSFFIHVVIDGLTYAFGVLAVEFVDDLGSTRQLNGWITSVLVGVILGSGPIVSLLCGRFGNRNITIAGAIVAWAGFAVSYFVTRPAMFILTISLIAGFGISLIYLPAIVCVGIYFEKRRSTAVGIAVCGSGLGIFVFGPFINYLIDQYTWRGAMLILSGIVLNCAVFGCLLRPLPTVATVAAAPAACTDSATAEETQPLTAEESQPREAEEPRSTGRQRAAAGDFLSLQNLHHQNHQQRHRTFSTGANAGTNMSAAAAAATAASQPSSQLLHPPAPLLASRSAFVMASAMSLTATAAVAEAAAAGENGEPPAATSDVKPRGLERASIGNRVDKLLKLSLLKNPVFLLFVASNLLFNVGFDAPFLYTPDRAQHAGYSAQQGSLLLSVIGIANLVGRLIFGFLSDSQRVSKTALYAASLSIAGVALFFSFISNAYAFMAVYCAVFGVFVGAYVTMTPAVLAHLLGADKLNDSFGLTLLFQGIGVLVGPPVAGALFDHTNSFNISYMASGSCMMVSGIMLFPLPCLLRRQAAKGKQVCSDPVTIEL